MELSDETLAELVALAGVALSYEELSDALAEICRIAARAVRNADGATLTSFSASGPNVAAASNEWAEQLDEMQYVEHEGPCIDAARAGLLFRIRDISEEVRWPAYMPRAHALGARSMLSIPMTVESKTIGALNVYAREVDAFTAEDVSIAEIIAGHASLATQVAATLHSHRHLAKQLHSAMASRAVIEQAKGVLMGTASCGSEEAFERLLAQAHQENRPLREVAEELVGRYGRVVGPNS